MIIKDENPDYLFNPDEKLLVFPQLPETVALNVDFLMHRLQDQKELSDKYEFEIMDYVEEEEEFSPYAQKRPDLR